MAAPHLFPRAGPVPVLLDGDHVTEAQCGTLQYPYDAAPRASSHIEALCRSADPDELSDLDLEHDAGCGRIHRDLARLWRHACLPARAHAVCRCRFDRVDRGGDLSRAATAALYPAGGRDQPARSRQHLDCADPDLSDDAGDALRLAVARLFQDRAEGIG